MHLNLSQLRALLAVATQGSFTKAAEALHTTQPALSAKIQQIEDVLGARLFDRTTRSVALTNFARDLLPAVERIIGETEALLGRAGEIARLEIVVRELGEHADAPLGAGVEVHEAENVVVEVAIAKRRVALSICGSATFAVRGQKGQDQVSVATKSSGFGNDR